MVSVSIPKLLLHTDGSASYRLINLGLISDFIQLNPIHYDRAEEFSAKLFGPYIQK